MLLLLTSVNFLLSGGGASGSRWKRDGAWYRTPGAEPVVPYYSEHRVLEGDDFSLDCPLPPADKSHAAAVYWQKDGRRIQDSPRGYELRVRASPNNPVAKVLTLTVRKAQVFHSGDYSCANTTESYHHVLVAPRIASGQHAAAADCYTLRPNESLEINCSLPEAGGAVRWYHEGKELGEARGRWSVRGRTLVIASARSSDAGAYSCRAGDREASALQVVAPVVLEPVRRPYVADAGDTVSIPCKVLAGRPSRVSWLVGGVPLGASGSRARLSRSASGVADSLLTLPDVAPEDSNVYTCRARHEQCSRPVAAAQETSLHVWPHGVRTNEELPGAGLTIRPDDPELTISCWRSDNKSGTFVWTKEGAELATSGRLSVAPSNITIRHPQQEDAGNYRCRLLGSNVTVSIQVRYKVFCYLDAQHSVPAPSYWIRGQQGRLAVHLTGWPPARIEWLKEGLTISPLDGRLRFEDHLNVSKAALVVQTASDADRGNYSCLARNGYDADRFDVYVRVRHKYAFVVPLSGIAIQVFVLLAIIGASELRRRRPGHKRDRKNRGATAQGASVDGIRGAT